MTLTFLIYGFINKKHEIYFLDIVMDIFTLQIHNKKYLINTVKLAKLKRL